MPDLAPARAYLAAVREAELIRAADVLDRAAADRTLAKLARQRGAFDALCDACKRMPAQDVLLMAVIARGYAGVRSDAIGNDVWDTAASAMEDALAALIVAIEWDEEQEREAAPAREWLIGRGGHPCGSEAL